MEMKLDGRSFDKIKAGTKTVELRLNDEKRKNIKVGDVIVFTRLGGSETLRVRVTGLRAFADFAELFGNYDKIAMGYNADDVADWRDMEKYYSIEEQRKWGALAIEIAKTV